MTKIFPSFKGKMNLPQIEIHDFPLRHNRVHFLQRQWLSQAKLSKAFIYVTNLLKETSFVKTGNSIQLTFAKCYQAPGTARSPPHMDAMKEPIIRGNERQKVIRRNTTKEELLTQECRKDGD